MNRLRRAYGETEAGRVTGKAARVAGERPMRSKVNWGLLGLLIDKPDYGYGLVRRFDEFWGDALPLTKNSLVYDALHALEGRELVEETTVVGPTSSLSRGEPRPGVRASERGIESYVRHLPGSLDDSRRRWVVVARQLALLASHPKLGLESIERCRRSVLDQASAGRVGVPADEPHDEASALASRLVDELDRSQTRWIIDWLDYAEREFEELARIAGVAEGNDDA